MKKLTDYMAEELSAAFEKAGYDSSYGKVGVSNRPDLCEYQCNGAMAGAKAYKKAPFMLSLIHIYYKMWGSSTAYRGGVGCLFFFFAKRILQMKKYFGTFFFETFL